MNRKKIVSAMLIVTLTCGLGLTACGGTQGSVPGTEEAEVQRYAWPLGSSSPEDTVTQIYAEKFAEEVDPVKRRKHENQCLSKQCVRR